MKKITLMLDEETYSILEEDRRELSQQKYIIKLLKEYQLSIVLKKKLKNLQQNKGDKNG